MSNPWTALADYSFTTYFGTKLHGAEITWYNNPDSTTASEADELKMEILMNMYSRQYVWWDATNSDDAAWFTGQTDTDGLTSPATITAAATAIADVGDSDIIFHMQVTNPVSTATPTYDGVYAAMTHVVTFDGATNPTFAMAWHANIVDDLTPAADGDMDLTLDTTADAGCTDEVWT